MTRSRTLVAARRRCSPTPRRRRDHRERRTRRRSTAARHVVRVHRPTLLVSRRRARSSDEGLGWLRRSVATSCSDARRRHRVRASSERGVKEQWFFPKPICRGRSSATRRYARRSVRLRRGAAALAVARAGATISSPSRSRRSCARWSRCTRTRAIADARRAALREGAAGAKAPTTVAGRPGVRRWRLHAGLLDARSLAA